MENQSRGGGKVPVAAFVMAFVKGDEIYRFREQGQSVRGIARYYDRNPDTVERAIRILNDNEAAFQTKDVLAVGAKVWKGRLGWQRFESFLTAHGYIQRGELMPKDGPEGRRRPRRRAARTGGVGQQNAAVGADKNPPAGPPTAPASATERQKMEPVPPAGRDQDPDDVLDKLRSKMPIVRQATNAATRT